MRVCARDQSSSVYNSGALCAIIYIYICELDVCSCLHTATLIVVWPNQVYRKDEGTYTDGNLLSVDPSLEAE